MSDITTKIKAYRAGKTDFDTLKRDFATRTYKDQDRHSNYPSDPEMREKHVDEAEHYTDGSWDEVTRAYDSGLLTRDEFYAINDAAREASGLKP